ncbi:MAG: DUF1573 domain-containing protein [Saprospiraceae bacterium]|nr:DUF1573 domain-containing protein [Saprospiraceae bacterium]
MKLILSALLTYSILLLAPSSKVEWLSPKTHDFGEVKHKTELTHHFTFKNTSEAPFVIDNVRTSCGCTAADWQETPILPDSTARIEIVYDAHDLGYFRKYVKVFVSGQRKAEKLFLEGEVIP